MNGQAGTGAPFDMDDPRTLGDELTCAVVRPHDTIEDERRAHNFARRFFEHGARAVQASFTDQDDDWGPAWLLVGPDSGLFVMSSAHKYDQVALVTWMVEQVDFTLVVGQLFSSWMARVEDVGSDRLQEVVKRGGQVSEMDEGEKREILLLQTIGKENVRGYTAAIERHRGAPPTLGQFDPLPFHGVATGAMLDPIREVLGGQR